MAAMGERGFLFDGVVGFSFSFGPNIPRQNFGSKFKTKYSHLLITRDLLTGCSKKINWLFRKFRMYSSRTINNGCVFSKEKKMYGVAS